MRTIKSSYDRLSLCPLLDDKLDVRIRASKLLQVVVNICPRVGGGGPFIAKLKDKLADLRNKGNVPVGRLRR